MNGKGISKVFRDIQNRVEGMALTFSEEGTEQVKNAIDETAIEAVRRLYEAGEVTPGVVDGAISLGKNVELDVLCILPYLDWVDWYGKYTVRHNGEMIGTVEYKGPAQQRGTEVYYYGAETYFEPAGLARSIEIVFNFDVAAK